ncbi:hypothetical protein Pyn_05179 [Prunus yedoensis var. nudiflora]|uniref:Uncharacterized protein n=1 Tax=Prunus yedoensis var. nudiflora TaxID=2094558 RepID=A0A314UAR0_PRUYE|nr:hypothetical protein Pyn_05179 [Prunus yedoensis var. nudiflora]
MGPTKQNHIVPPSSEIYDCVVLWVQRSTHAGPTENQTGGCSEYVGGIVVGEYSRLPNLNAFPSMLLIGKKETSMLLTGATVREKLAVRAAETAVSNPWKENY